MPQYVLNIVQPDGPPPAPEQLGPIMAEVGKVMQAMQEAGDFVMTAGLAPAAQAAVVRTTGGRRQVFDGPFAEAKEHVGGFVLVRAATREAALDWAERLSRATTLPIEVREVAHGG